MSIWYKVKEDLFGLILCGKEQYRATRTKKEKCLHEGEEDKYQYKGEEWDKGEEDKYQDKGEEWDKGEEDKYQDKGEEWDKGEEDKYQDKGEEWDKGILPCITVTVCLLSLICNTILSL